MQSSQLLDDAENLCEKILLLIDSIPPDTISEKGKEKAKTKIISIKKDISISKKKIMMRTAKGAELADKVKNSASKFEKKLIKISELQLNKTKEDLSFSAELNELESDLTKMTTYWHSFEAVIT